MQKDYIYKVYRGTTYLGLLPVVSPFKLSQDINTHFVQLELEVALPSDRTSEPVQALLDETGAVLLDENGETLLEERRPDYVGGYSSGALIANENSLLVYEVSTAHPNGTLVFSGIMTTNSARYGSTDNISITCISNGADLNNYLISGIQTSDQSQLTQNSTYLMQGFTGSSFQIGQEIAPSASATNISKIVVKLAAVTTNNPIVKAKLYASNSSGISNLSQAISGATPSVSYDLTVTSTSPTDYTIPFGFDFPSIPNYYLVVFSSADSSGVNIYYKNTDAYAPLPGLLGPGGTFDLYFQTFYTAPSTLSDYTAFDPTNILKSIIDSYVTRGGLVNYAVGSTDLTGVSTSYTFNSNTTLEGVNKALDLAPSDWYWYVDPGSSVLYFKQTATTARHTFLLGKHINSLELTRTVDNLVNYVIFTGGDPGTGILYRDYTNPDSISSHGRRVLKRLYDGRVTVPETADLIANNALDQGASEIYQSSITILASSYDISSINVGDVIGFGGFGLPVDGLLLQVVRRTYQADFVDLKLGQIPPRETGLIAQALDNITDIQNQNNPSTPS